MIFEFSEFRHEVRVVLAYLQFTTSEYFATTFYLLDGTVLFWRILGKAKSSISENRASCRLEAR